jgi:hypothetical protein
MRSRGWRGEVRLSLGGAEVGLSALRAAVSTPAMIGLETALRRRSVLCQRIPSEALDGDQGQLVGRRLRYDAIVVDLDDFDRLHGRRSWRPASCRLSWWRQP